MDNGHECIQDAAGFWMHSENDFDARKVPKDIGWSSNRLGKRIHDLALPTTKGICASFRILADARDRYKAHHSRHWLECALRGHSCATRGDAIGLRGAIAVK